MIEPEQLPDWYEPDVVCVALVPAGQVVDWSSGSYVPEDALWPPEGTFVRLPFLAAKVGLSKLASLDLYKQERLNADECGEALARWEEFELAVRGTPGAEWAAAIGLIFRRCATSSGVEVFIEGPY